LRLVVFLVSCVLWGHVASASPGVIIVPRVELHEAPSEAARVVSELVGGDAIYVVDETNDARAAHPGWLAIRRGGGIQYVHSEAVHLAAAAPAGVHLYDGEEPGGNTAVPAPATPSPTPPSAADETGIVAGTFLPMHPVRISLGLGSGVGWIQEGVARRHDIGSVGPTLHTSLGLTIYDLFAISGELGIVYPRGNSSSGQGAVLASGGQTESSGKPSLHVVSLSITAGLRTPFFVLRPKSKGAFSAALFADVGSSKIFGERSSSDCTDCLTEHLGMPSGTFWRAGFDLASEASGAGEHIHSTYDLNVAYQRYEAGAGLVQEIRIGLIWLCL
jgi:hypothetical protein